MASEREPLMESNFEDDADDPTNQDWKRYFNNGEIRIYKEGPTPGYDLHSLDGIDKVTIIRPPYQEAVIVTPKDGNFAFKVPSGGHDIVIQTIEGELVKAIEVKAVVTPSFQEALQSILEQCENPELAVDRICNGIPELDITPGSIDLILWADSQSDNLQEEGDILLNVSADGVTPDGMTDKKELTDETGQDYEVYRRLYTVIETNDSPEPKRVFNLLVEVTIKKVDQKTLFAEIDQYLLGGKVDDSILRKLVDYRVLAEVKESKEDNKAA